MIAQQKQINDKLLITAAFRAAMKMDEYLPTPSKCDHQFSEGFHQKMRILYEQMGWKYNPEVMEK